MTAPIADGVMAATHKLVQQAMTGQWQEVPKTIQERRDLLARISSTARPQDQQWLSALRQAMTESDATVAQMVSAAGASVSAVGPASAGQSFATEPTDAVATVMDMLGKGG
jgi:catalase (peroxidase I)